MKILYFDTETTGTNPHVHEITQFAAVVEIDGKVEKEVNWRCQPTNWDKIDKAALEVTGIGIEKLKTFESPTEMFRRISSMFDEYIDKYDPTDKFYPAGHNVGFDLDFLQSFWKKHGDKYGTGSYQNWRMLDSRILANFLIAAGLIETPDVKLGTLCEHFKIEIDAHDALSDIRATRELILKLREYIH